MVLTEAQIEEMKKAATPLVKWLNENCHPHVTVEVTLTGAEASEGLASVSITEFLKD